MSGVLLERLYAVHNTTRGTAYSTVLKYGIVCILGTIQNIPTCTMTSKVPLKRLSGYGLQVRATAVELLHCYGRAIVEGGYQRVTIRATARGARDICA